MKITNKFEPKSNLAIKHIGENLTYLPFYAIINIGEQHLGESR